MKKIFITGASGYVGSNVAHVLSKKNKLFCLTNKKQKTKANIKWIVGTLSSNLNEYLKKSDFLIHCAASGVYKKTSKKKIIKTNRTDSINFLKKAYGLGCRKWILLGTSGEYGFIKNKPMSVYNTKLKPVTIYGKSKADFFNDLKKLNFIDNCQILYLRIFHVYGGNEPPTRMYSGLLNASKSNIDFKMTKGDEIRDFIHINKVAQKIKYSLKLFKNKNFFTVKHLASGKKTSVKKFALHKWKLLKSKKKILFGKSSKKKIYHTMYSDKKSLL